MQLEFVSICLPVWPCTRLDVLVSAGKKKTWPTDINQIDQMKEINQISEIKEVNEINQGEQLDLMTSNRLIT